MDDCRYTVLITGLKGDFRGADFIKTFSSFGEIKTHSETGHRLAEMKIVRDRSGKEGIVTYVDQMSAAEATRKLNGTQLDGNDGKTIYVETAENYCCKRMRFNVKVPTEYGNLAWRLWREEGLRESGGGRGGKGGGVSSLRSLLPEWLVGKPGNAGEPGKPGPCGEGGKGGKPAHG